MYITRSVYFDLEAHLTNKEYTILTGARQTGKTSILRQLYSKLKNEGKAAFFISLEDPDTLASLNAHPSNLFKITGTPQSHLLDHPSDVSERLYVFIDEIQYLENPTNFLKYLYDMYLENLKLIVTGSSAFYIDRKFKDSLVGRKRLFWLKTLTFDEFLVFKNAPYLVDELNRLRENASNTSLQYGILKTYFNEYLTYGGYPAVVLQNSIDDKKYLLNEIKNSYLRRDVYESNVGNEAAFFNLIRLLADQVGSLVNRNELSATLKVDNKTIDNYLYVLQKCFHIELVKPFYGNLRKEITKMPKVYFYDLGLRNALLNRFELLENRADKGEIVENYVFRKFSDLYEPDNVRFWRTADRHEVDFVVSTEFGKGKAYEVKFDENGINRRKYQLFTENFPNYPLSFLTYNPSELSSEIIRLS